VRQPILHVLVGVVGEGDIEVDELDRFDFHGMRPFAMQGGMS